MRASLVAVVITVLTTLACTGGDTTIVAPPPPAALAGAGTKDSPHIADCWTTAQQMNRSVGQNDIVQCPAGCTSGAIWGTTRYTPDSKVCVAGVHAGVLVNAGSGLVQVKMEGTYSNFSGSTAYGVTSLDWSSSYDTSFSVGEVADGRGKAGKGEDDDGKAGKGGKGKGGKGQ